MVHLTTASGAFHARVVAARLGAEGIPAELRGDAGTYPVGGPVEVLVPEGDVAAARQILQADAAEAALGDQVDEALGEAPVRPGLRRAMGGWPAWVALTTVLIVLVAGFAAHVL